MRMVFYYYLEGLFFFTLCVCMCVCVQVVGTVFYMVAAALHRNRQRHDDDSLQQRLIIENQLRNTITA